MHPLSHPTVISTDRWRLLCGIALLATVLILIGCSALTSSQVTDGSPLPVKGAAYCLPMGKVTIEVRKKTQPVTAAAPTAVAPAQPAPVVVMPADPLPTANPVKPISAPPTQPRTSSGETTRDYRITYKQTVYVPDPTKRFAVRYLPNAMAEDDIHIQVGKDSLLALVDVTVEDQSVEAAKKLIEIGKNVFKIAARGAVAFADIEIKEEVIFTATFDPTSPQNLAEINALLQKVEGHPYSVALLNRSSPDYKAAHSTYHSADAGKREFSGVAFRPALAYDMVLSHGRTPQEVDTVLLPNEAEILYMPVTRSVFVKKVEKLSFDSGMLVEAVVKKPSEIVSGLDIPLEISRAILALPGEIVSDNLAGLKQRDEVNKQKLSTAQSQGALQRGKIDEQILNTEEKKKQLDAAAGSTPQPSPSTP